MLKITRIEKINKTKANIPLTLRLPEDIYNEYKKLSKETNQSFNSLVVASLRYSLQNMEK